MGQTTEEDGSDNSQQAPLMPVRNKQAPECQTTPKRKAKTKAAAAEKASSNKKRKLPTSSKKKKAAVAKKRKGAPSPVEEKARKREKQIKLMLRISLSVKPMPMFPLIQCIEPIRRKVPFGMLSKKNLIYFFLKLTKSKKLS
jgi:hypothetical protein